MAVLSLDLFAVLFGGAEALLPMVSTEILKVGEVGYGWLRSAHGIGVAISFADTNLYSTEKTGRQKIVGLCSPLWYMHSPIWSIHLLLNLIFDAFFHRFI